MEVTQLSLFLKMLEDETQETITQKDNLLSVAILPNLNHNIFHGNSLIGKEIEEQKDLFDQCDFKHLYPFDFLDNLPKIKLRGGVDVIIGNPPYVKEYTSKETFENVKLGKLKKYFQGKMDLWYFFVCYGIDLLKKDGYLGYIVPNNWVSNAGASILRNKILEDCKIEALIDFEDYMVFTNASIQTMIILLSKNNSFDNYEILHQHFKGRRLNTSDVAEDLCNIKNCKCSSVEYPTISKSKLKDKFIKFDAANIDAILDKILIKRNFELDEKKEVAQGIVPNADVLSKKSFEKIPSHIVNQYNINAGDPIFVVPKGYFNSLSTIEKDFIKPMFEPSDLGKYYLNPNNKKELIYLTKNNEVKGLSNIIKHLTKFKNVLDERRETQQGKMKYYHLHWPRTEQFFNKGEKILSVRKCAEPLFCYTDKPAYVMMSFNVIKTARLNMKYLCGLFNSKLVKFWLLKKGKMQGSQFQVDKEPLLEIPIHVPQSQMEINKIASIVEKIIEVKTSYIAAKTESDQTFYERQLKRLENDIDTNIYNFYSISMDEQKLIESALEKI